MLSDVPGCPIVTDAWGTVNLEDRSLSTSAIDAMWERDFAKAQYLVLTESMTQYAILQNIRFSPELTAWTNLHFEQLTTRTQSDDTGILIYGRR
jgi:hypothetical protein